MRGAAAFDLWFFRPRFGWELPVRTNLLYYARAEEFFGG